MLIVIVGATATAGVAGVNINKVDVGKYGNVVGTIRANGAAQANTDIEETIEVVISYYLQIGTLGLALGCASYLPSPLAAMKAIVI
jgi:S-adenosylmethionine hydrolase